MLDEPVVGTWREYVRQAVAGQRKAFARPPRQRHGSLFRSIHGALCRIFLEYVNPRRSEQPVVGSQHEADTVDAAYDSPRRETSSAVRMRSTCWVVNMNIAASSV